MIALSNLKKKIKKIKCLEYTEALKTFMKNVMPRCNAKM